MVLVLLFLLLLIIYIIMNERYIIDILLVNKMNQSGQQESDFFFQ